ncbi:MAG: asparagine synthase (glutamine-hydrolyzing) [Chlorobi bacterium]|nr:asparagine synthase (glutamine-hydrolyzing) [Chlorobiota bacterium]
MCGIAGFYQHNDNTDNKINTLRNMLTRIKHRGPDESGIYLSHKAGLGSVRLSIIDLSTGTMPLSNFDESLWIVFNGEIFNYIELKEELINKNHTFRTNSDTEVVVHLYEEYGPEFLKKLNGQFAIAIWDKNKQELFLARDRVGIRPLFYTQVGKSFVFASEIKSLIEFPGVNFKISPKALSQYFTFWTSLSPNTVFEGIFEVTPGHYLKINSNSIKDKIYWELPVYKPKEYYKINIDEATKKFTTIFNDAIKIRLRADVQVGAYLSGGLDSCITTSSIKEVSSNNLKTFSIGFADKEFDESSYQKMAVDYFKTEHESIECGFEDIANEFTNVIWHTETPILRTSPAPMSLLAKVVKDNNLKVVITGEGADELCGGYNIFKESKIRLFWSKQPKSNLRPLLLKKLYPYIPMMKTANITALKLFFGYKLEETNSPIYSHLLRWNNTSRIVRYLSKDYKKRLDNYKPIEELEKVLEKKLEGINLLSRAQWIEIHLFMSGYLLSSQGDRMTMANSVEGRYPFLDHRIIDFCMKLHPDIKINGLNEKFILKKMMNGKLPTQILNRPKQAYRAPIRSAFISENIPENLKKLLSENQIKSFGIFNPDHVNQLLEKMKSKKIVSEIDNMALTGILSTQILHDLFINKSRPELKEKDLVEFDKIILDQ